MIILGDAGINYHLDIHDDFLKMSLKKLPITLFCIHGNHEERPENCNGYVEIEWNEGIAYCEPEFPNIIFAKDGEIYDLDGYKTLVIGGAYSVDKYYRIIRGMKWFASEQSDDETKSYGERKLSEANWEVDVVLTHTAPKQYEPTWAFIPGLDQSKVDKSTEEWLDEIEKRLSYDYWYAGNYHVDSYEGSIHFMYEGREEFLEE